MTFSSENKKRKGSFKFPYSRGLPSYMAPKIFTTQKTEEYFVTTLYAQHLLYNRIHTIGVETCGDDSHKKADSIVKLENGKIIKVQVTRFTLTEYLNRRKIAENKVEKIIKEINKIEKINIPVNITFNAHKYAKLLPNSSKFNRAVANLIVEEISKNKEKLEKSGVFINEIVNDEKLKEYLPIITLQRIPDGHNSNYFGRDNVFIDMDFDNITFTQDDIDKESLNIYNKKNGGESEVLLIWADTFEILYDTIPFKESLEKQFSESSFEEVYFFKFYNRLEFTGQIEIDRIRGNEQIYK